MRRRSPTRRAAAAACVALGLAGCAGPARLAQVAAPAGLPAVVELADTPFHAQSDQQCGPAALATVLGSRGRAATPAQLAGEIFVPGRAGSLQPELVAALRARGVLPYLLGNDTVEVMSELAAGRPVLVLQKQGLGPWPAWHYAVVVGYDQSRDTLLLRSGTTKRLELRASLFEATWDRAGRWAVVALEPGELPARPDLARYMQAAASMEAVGRVDDAAAAYSAAVAHWPQESLPRLGLANVEAARSDWVAAERGYAAALALDPASAAALNNRGEALLQLGCPAAALAAIDGGLSRVATDDPLRPVIERTRQVATARAAAADPPACRGVVAR